MIVPKLKQRKDGNWTVKVDGKNLNLQTTVYAVARERAKEAAYEGKRDFTTDSSRFYQSTTDTPTAATGAPAGIADDWQSDVADAVSAGLKPDAYINGNGSAFPLLGPADVDGAPPPPNGAPHTPDEKPPTPDGSTTIPPEMFEGMMLNAATVLVEAQIRGQEWLIARALKANAGPVPMSNIGREAATKFWQQQLAKWMPSDVPLPEWAAAMIACAMFSIPVQLQGATPIKVEQETASPNYPTTAP